MRRFLMMAGLLVLAVGFAVMPASGGVLVNGDFETGDLTGWTVFTTSSNGTNGAGLPDVVPFDVTGGGASNAAQFEVGQITFDSGVQEGGGLLQVFHWSGGTARLSVDVAASQPFPPGNGSGGVFSLLLDGVVLDTFTVGDINAGEVFRSKLAATVVNLAAGDHEFKILITRPFGSTSSLTPFQYIDNAAVVPEPSTLVLAGLGGLGLVGMAMRRRSAG